MAEILAVLRRFEGEGSTSFRERCGLFILHGAYGKVPDGAVGVSRMAVGTDPVGLRPDETWGLAHASKPLPSDTCVIAAYASSEARLAVLPFDPLSLEQAPVNPGCLPRLPYRMTLAEFSAAAVIKELGVGQEGRWAVFLDGVPVGRAEGRTLTEAAAAMHLRSVVNALSACSECRDLPEVGMTEGQVLPLAATIAPYRSRFEGLGFDATIEQCQMVEWTEAMSTAAVSEGWDIFEVLGEGPLAIQCDSDAGLLGNDDDAAALVWHGGGSHHIVARTLLLESAPWEYARIRQVAHAEVEGNQPRRTLERAS